jgi:uncharacterized protein (DUF433 family)
MRIRVIDVIDLLESGKTQEEILLEMPDLESNDVVAAVQYFAESIDTCPRPPRAV